jgi:cell division protein FtsN
VADNDCTNTDWWRMGLANNIIFFVMFTIIMVAVLVMFFIGYSQTTPKSNRIVDKGKEQLAESEERMMPGEENKEATLNKSSTNAKETIEDKNKEEHKDGDTDDKNKSDKKDEAEQRDDLDEEMDEIY